MFANNMVMLRQYPLSLREKNQKPGLASRGACGTRPNSTKLALFPRACMGRNGRPGPVARRDGRRRNELVDKEIVAEGVKNKRVIEAMRNTPRHEFVPSNLRKQAYFDMALPIGEGQTISPPFIVAYMTEAIDPQPSDKVLEIGTGSGYQAAVLSAGPRGLHHRDRRETGPHGGADAETPAL